MIDRLRTLSHLKCFKRCFSSQKLATSSASSLLSKSSHVREGWSVVHTKSVPELGIDVRQIKHEKSQCCVFHIQNECDEVNAFSVNFKTLPEKSDGISHILEHTVLCGSEKFPVRDPFFKMLNRSMSTFMNAMTGPDYTMYPFCTPNVNDYYNLMSVYLDAVFRPNLSFHDFRQEGWRLEHSDVNDRNSPIVIKGVVYNEMIGAYNDSQQKLARHVLSSILPSNAYSVCSGGLPSVIPELTWKQLCDFHRKYYSPDNSTIFLYGRDEGDISQTDGFQLNKTLKLIESYVVDTSLDAQKTVSDPTIDKDVQHTTKRPTIPREKDFDGQPPLHTITCSAQDSVPESNVEGGGVNINNTSTLAVTYRTCSSVHDVHEVFALSILSRLLLVDDPNSPLYKPIFEAGLGQTFAPCTGYESDTRDTFLTIAIQGMDPSKKDEILSIIDKCLRDSNGLSKTFSESRINSVLHSIELGLKKRGTNFGLGVIMGVTSALNHVEDLNDKVAIDRVFDVQCKIDTFKTEYEKHGVSLFENLISKYLVENKNRVVTMMNVEKDYNDKQTEILEKVKNDKLNKLSETEREKVYEDGLQLQKLQDEALQNEAESLECLPTLRLNDIPLKLKVMNVPKERKIILWNREIIMKNGLQINPQPTNDIVYLRTLLPRPLTNDETNNMNSSELPILLSLLADLGAGTHAYQDLTTKIDLTCGGLSSTVHLQRDPNIESNGAFDEYVLLSSYCLKGNVEEMVNLWNDVLNKNHLFDSEYRSSVMDRIKTLIQMMCTSSMSGISHSGHSFAVKAACALTSHPFAVRSESLSGLSFIRSLFSLNNRLVGGDVASSAEVLARLQELHVRTFGEQDGTHRMRIAVNCPEDVETDAISTIQENFLPLIPEDKLNLKSLKLSSTELAPNKSVSQEASSDTPYNKLYLQSPMFSPSLYYTSHAKPTSVSHFTHPDAPALNVLSSYLKSHYLHPTIREKGGAYGSGMNFNSTSGLISFFSYRDPQCEATFDVFDGCENWLTANTHLHTSNDEKRLEEAKLNVFKSFDSPVAAGARGMSLFMNGVTDEMVEEVREGIRKVTKQDMLDVCSKYVGGDGSNQTPYKDASVVLGPVLSEGERGDMQDKGWNVKDMI